MFLRKYFAVKTSCCIRLLLPDHNYYFRRRTLLRPTNNLCINLHRGSLFLNSVNTITSQPITYSVLLHRRYYSKGLTDNDSSNIKYDKEIIKIKELYPLPRVTLNELATKAPEKIFDVHYKQIVNTPKGAKKKVVLNNDWNCTYSFVWPEKMKFESTAVSKRQAAEKAATQALHWLYVNKRIDNHGNPIYKKDTLNDLRNTIITPLSATISSSSIERIGTIWNDYQNDIKSIYEATYKEGNKLILARPVALKKDSTIDEDDAEDLILLEDIEDTSELKTQVHPVFGTMYRPPSKSTLAKRERFLYEKFQHYDDSLTTLPIDQYADQIASTLGTSRVAVIVGAAGCGKSTRVPAVLLRRCGAKTAAIVSEPRRVAAIGLAQRVADELGEQVGYSVGYQVRLHAKQPRVPGGAILYCTSGVLLRRLQLNPGLEGCTHVFIDEAHERDVNTDITLLLLKRALDLNPELRVVVMSATLDVGVFTSYFDRCPVIEVPGRTFPVEVLHLDGIRKKFNIALPTTLENCTKEDGKPQINCQEVVEVIKAVDRTEKEGAILVFLPGWAEIKLAKMLLDDHYGQNDSCHMILPVHSRLSTSDQAKMFSKPLPGVRKIVLATNIAETSITIPDVVHVIDTGAHKENRIKEGTGTASLETVWVSQAGAKQRTGRAGRVQPGTCYRMYTKDKETEFAPHTTPEILRIPLEQTVLDCKTYAPDEKVENFLSQLPEPPSKRAIDFAVQDLTDIGALSPTEHLTRLGALLSSLTLPPRLGLSLLYSAVVGNVVAVATVATHCSDNVELFRNAADRREEIRGIKRKYSPTSDHSALHWIQQEFEQNLDQSGWQGVGQWCDQYELRKERLTYVKSLSNLHLEQLLKSGFIEANPDLEELNRFSDIDELTAGVLFAGSNSLLMTKKCVKTKGKLKTAVELFTSKGDRAHIGSESINYGVKKRKLTNQLLTYYGGYHSTERRALVVHKTSLVPLHTALLFSMGDVRKEQVDLADTTALYLSKHNLRIQMPTGQADLILKARHMIKDTFQYYVVRDLSNVKFDDHTAVSRFKVRLVKTIGRILVEAEKELLKNCEIKRLEN